jgi:hypothetical protein
VSDTPTPTRVPSRFLVTLLDGRPVAVLRDGAPDNEPDLRRHVGETLSQGYLADVPEHASMVPAAAREVYSKDRSLMGLAAKEGHGITRQAVDLHLQPPPRRPADQLSRRPVVALVDTAVSFHPWLGEDGGAAASDDAFWRDARTIRDAWDPGDAGGVPVPEETLDPQSTHGGHGTFIAGIVRQVAPDATVLSLPVMDSAGAADPALVRSALAWLLRRARRAADEGRPDLAVDVVNLSFGRYLDVGRVPPEEDTIKTLIDDLGRLGVRVIASAGNHGDSGQVLPAAWSGDDTDELVALKSVGSVDPNGHPSPYSNHGPWVTAAARGTAVVSCLPMFDAVVPWPTRPAPEPDELARHEDPNLQLTTFARWAGTSFASGIVSATVAAHLLDPAIAGDLRQTDTDLVIARARKAWRGFDAMPDPKAASTP